MSKRSRKDTEKVLDEVVTDEATEDGDNKHILRNMGECGVCIHRVGRLPQFSFDTLKENTKERTFFQRTLREYGAVEVCGVLSDAECKAAKSHFWDYMEKLGTGIARDDPSTHTNAHWPRNFSLGMIDEPETADAGQSAMCWYVRGRENVRMLHSYAYNCDPSDLAGSLDRFGMQRTEYVKRERNSKMWFHNDQNPVRRDFNSCYQGIVNLIPTRNGDPGFVCIPHSHQKLAEWPKHMDIPGSTRDFIRMSDDILTKVLSPDAEILKANADAGSMILFSSALVHCNGFVDHSSRTNVDGLSRLVCYASMQPVRSIPNWKTNVLPQRIDFYNNGITSSHWTEFCRAIGKCRFPRHDTLLPLAKRMYTPIPLDNLQKAWLYGPYVETA